MIISLYIVSLKTIKIAVSQLLIAIGINIIERGIIRVKK